MVVASADVVVVVVSAAATVVIEVVIAEIVEGTAAEAASAISRTVLHQTELQLDHDPAAVDTEAVVEEASVVATMTVRAMPTTSPYRRVVVEVGIVIATPVPVVVVVGMAVEARDRTRVAGTTNRDRADGTERMIMMRYGKASLTRMTRLPEVSMRLTLQAVLSQTLTQHSSRHCDHEAQCTNEELQERSKEHQR